MLVIFFSYFINENIEVFIYVSVDIITIHNRVHYFVSILWPSILIFSVFSTDILCELCNLLDVCLRSTRFFLFLRLSSLTSFVPTDHMFRWPTGYMIFPASSLDMCKLPVSLVRDPNLRGMLANSLPRVVFVNTSCKLYLQTCCLQMGPSQVVDRRSNSLLRLELTIIHV